MDKCLFCENEVKITPSHEDKTFYDCPKCGNFSISGSLEPTVRNEYYIKYHSKISSWISEQNIIFKEKNVYLHSNIIEQISHLANKKMKEKFDSVVKFISNHNFCTLQDLNYCYLNKKEFNAIFLNLEKKDFIKFTRIPNKYHDNNENFHCTLTYDGIEYLESLEQTNKNSKNIFAAFHFTKELQTIFDTEIKTAIEALDYTYVRVSSSTTDLDTHINDDIIAKLRSAKLVIADFTGQRNSVYFEVGFAMGLNIPIIWTCQEDDVDDLSFDTRQYPHIVWKDADDLADKITKRIQALPFG